MIVMKRVGVRCVMIVTRSLIACDDVDVDGIGCLRDEKRRAFKINRGASRPIPAISTMIHKKVHLAIALILLDSISFLTPTLHGSSCHLVLALSVLGFVVHLTGAD